jgi:transposase
MKPNPRSVHGTQGETPGAHLAQVETPDVTIPHPPPACRGCGASLADAEVVRTETRQVFDIPEPRIIITSHVVETRRCGCGCETAGEFPAEATAPAVYGPAVSGVGAYLLTHQHQPVARTAETLSDLVGMEVSTGWVAGLLPKAQGILKVFLSDLRYRLMASPVMANDETGVHIDTESYWLHAATTEYLTLVTCHRNRGHLGMEDAGVLPEFRGISVHDRYAQYWLFGCSHSVCHAHLLRNLASVAERQASQSGWAEDMARLLLDVKAETERARGAGKASLTRCRLREISKAYDGIVTRAIRANPDPWLLGRDQRSPAEKESWNLALAFGELKTEILVFCKNLAVWFTSNVAERAIRMLKVHCKIGGFRTVAGAEAFCATWSYVSTARKHGCSPLAVLVAAFRGTPWMIPEPAPG